MKSSYHRLHNEENLIIRRLAPGDEFALAELRQLLNQQFAPVLGTRPIQQAEPDWSAYSAINPAQPADRGYWVLVDDRDQRVMGGMGFAPRQEEPREGVCELQHLILHPQLHGRNVGAKLVEYCMQEAGKLGYRQMYLESGLPGQPNLSINKNSGLRFFRTGRTVKVTGLSPSE